MKSKIQYVSGLKYSYKVIFTIRIIFLILYLVLFCLTIYEDGFGIFFENSAKFLTYWALWATLLYLMISTLNYSYFHLNVGAFATFNHIIVALNILVTIFWFSFIFVNPTTINFDFYLKILRHFVPLLFTFIEFILNNNIIFYKNLPYVLVITAIYIPINYLFSFYQERPVYDPIDYKDYMSAIIILAAVLLSLGSGALLVLAQSVFKPWIFLPFQKEYDRLITCENENDKLCEVKYEETKENDNEKLSSSKKV